MQGDFALLRSIAAGQKELLSLGRAILAELRKVPGMTSDGPQRDNTLQGVLGSEVVEDEERVAGALHDQGYSVHDRSAGSAEPGSIPLVHADRGLADGEHTGGDHKKGKDKHCRHDQHDDADYVPSSTEVNVWH